MNGLEHSKAGEALLQAIEYDVGGSESVEQRIAIAGVHAQLATAGAIAAMARTLQRALESEVLRSVSTRIAHIRYNKPHEGEAS